MSICWLWQVVARNNIVRCWHETDDQLKQALLSWLCVHRNNNILSSSESNSSSENESNGSQSRNTESKKDSNKIEVNISINKSSSFKKIPIAAKPISNKVFPEIRNSKKGLPEISAANRFQFKSPGLSSTSLNEVSSASYPNSNLGAINQNLISFGNKMNQLNNMPILSSLQKRCDTDNSIKIDGDNKKESYEPERNNNKRNTLNYSKRNSFLILSNKFNKMMGAKNK